MSFEPMREEDDKGFHINKLLERTGPFCDPEYEPGEKVKEFLKTARVLVIGAGGLGCEILKNLALMGFTDIHVIDMDTIDISNLNRQFLFRSKDVGRPKAIVAAEFIMNRVPGVKVTPYFGKIQDKDESYYMQFAVIICGLDSVEARRWINAMLVNMVDEENPMSMKPLIDGGTEGNEFLKVVINSSKSAEGLKGQSRVILPKITSCYECSLDMLGKPVTFPMCTIANTPRLPEHCIAWASSIQWGKEFPEANMDPDDPKHINWIYQAALERAEEFKIPGVTLSLTQGVIKNIIPAIASTNAIIAASCTNEAFKIVTSCAPYLNNYMMFVGDEGIYTYTFEHERKPDCPVCGMETLQMEVSPLWTLEDFIAIVQERPDIRQLKRPSFRSPSHSLYMQAPPSLEQATRPNLLKPMRDLIGDGEEISISDENLPINLMLTIKFNNHLEKHIKK